MHATDGVVVGGFYEPGFGIEDAVADMDAEDFADDEAVVADLDDAVAAALKADGGFGDAWWFVSGEIMAGVRTTTAWSWRIPREP